MVSSLLTEQLTLMLNVRFSTSYALGIRQMLENDVSALKHLREKSLSEVIVM